MRDDLQAGLIPPVLTAGNIPFGTSVLGELPRGAHHPPCPRHEHHLVFFGSRALCLGCTCMATGGVVGAIFMALDVFATVDFAAWLLIHTVAVFPTVLQPWLQRKNYKIFARTAVGFATMTWILGSVGLGPVPEGWSPVVWGAVALLFCFFSAKALLFVRERHTSNPCHDCPHGAYPTCSWNLERQTAIDPLLGEALGDIARRGAWTEDISLVNTADHSGDSDEGKPKLPAHD